MANIHSASSMPRDDQSAAARSSAQNYTPDSSARVFTDGGGTRWTVRQIVPEVRSVLHRVLLTRPGYENGWLSFRSEGMSCRIAPFPAAWRTISEYELERWCMKARDAARIRRHDSDDR